ncbi:MAG: hypothetical protein JWN89_172 [Parcubacteria group bacterium]|nr:hypothetical protein [Parcubacteria group bacterium]
MHSRIQSEILDGVTAEEVRRIVQETDEILRPFLNAVSDIQPFILLDRALHDSKGDIAGEAIHRERIREAMRSIIAQIRTPSEVLSTHDYFVGIQVFDQVIQKELGEKAKLIFGRWHPSTGGSSSWK